MALTVSKPNNIKMFDGNSLAVYIDADSDELSLKDINGNVSQLSSILSLGVRLTTEDNLILITENNISLIAQEDIGGGIGGTNYIYVMADGTDIGNAIELQVAYDLAKTMSPSATNRITIVCGLGYYNFGSTTFTMDTQYIDLVSLDGNRSIIFNSANSAGSISITANDVFVKGVDVGTKPFTIATSLNLLRVENCKGGDDSFGFGVTASGTFNDCEGGDDSFAFNGTASGVFNNCVGGDGAFGASGTASGTFNDCEGGDDSFAFNGTASGVFNDCEGGNDSFGSNATASGTFNNCVAGEASFGYGAVGTASGTFNDCVGGFLSFGASGTASGIFTNCVSGGASFGASGTASGTFTNCVSGGNGSFAFNGTASGVFNNCVGRDGAFGASGTASGTFTNCVGGNGSFGRTASGTFTNCIGGNESFGSNSFLTATASGTFNNCIGGNESFGRGNVLATLTGKLFYCRLTSGTFRTVSGGGITRLCLDGSNVENNQG